MPRRPEDPCASCGKLLYAGRGSLPAGQRTCRDCRRVNSRPYGPRATTSSSAPLRPLRVCAVCSASYRSVSAKQKTCSLSCGQRLRFSEGRGHDAHLDWVATTCAECGEEFRAYVKRYGVDVDRYCSTPCRDRRKQRVKRERGLTANSNHRSRARKHGVEYENVEAHRVFDRDAWRCQLCRRKVNPALRSPHPLSATLDHVLPIALGGGHTYANTQLAHRGCNLAKGIKGSDQLALIG